MFRGIRRVYSWSQQLHCRSILNVVVKTLLLKLHVSVPLTQIGAFWSSLGESRNIRAETNSYFHYLFRFLFCFFCV